MPKKHCCASNEVLGETDQRVETAARRSGEERERKRTKMKKILLIESSPRGSDSYSNQAARSIVKELQRHNSVEKVVVRDLAQSPPPHVGQAFVTGMYASPEQRTRSRPRPSRFQMRSLMNCSPQIRSSLPCRCTTSGCLRRSSRGLIT
jgi:flavodoxin-like protein